jgi:hypothetical protein
VKRSSALALLFLASLFAAGCGGSEKQLPTDILSPDDRVKEAPVIVPKASEPGAAKYIQERIAAATGGKPERLEKLKAYRQKAAGRWQWPNGGLPVNATRDVAAVWPGKVSVNYEFSAGEIKESHLVIRDGSARLANNLGNGFAPFDPPSPQEQSAIAVVDALAEQWMPVLVPLAEPNLVAFDLKDQPIGNQVARTVKVSLPNAPVFTLWFDMTTGLLGLVSFSHAEFGGKPIEKRMSVSGYKAIDGVSLPMLIECHRNGMLVQEWTVSRWEFPDKIDDAAFELKK